MPTYAQGTKLAFTYCDWSGFLLLFLGGGLKEYVFLFTNKRY